MPRCALSQGALHGAHSAGSSPSWEGTGSSHCSLALGVGLFSPSSPELSRGPSEDTHTFLLGHLDLSPWRPAWEYRMLLLQQVGGQSPGHKGPVEDVSGRGGLLPYPVLTFLSSVYCPEGGMHPALPTFLLGQP